MRIIFAKAVTSVLYIYKLRHQDQTCDSVSTINYVEVCYSFCSRNSLFGTLFFAILISTSKFPTGNMRFRAISAIDITISKVVG